MGFSKDCCTDSTDLPFKMQCQMDRFLHNKTKTTFCNVSQTISGLSCYDHHTDAIKRLHCIIKKKVILVWNDQGVNNNRFVDFG